MIRGRSGKQILFNNSEKCKLYETSSSWNVSAFQWSLQLLLEELFAAINISRHMRPEIVVELRAESVIFAV